jgi:hypothetical protein
LHLEERRTLLKKKKATETSVRKNTQLEFRWISIINRKTFVHLHICYIFMITIWMLLQWSKSKFQLYRPSSSLKPMNSSAFSIWTIAAFCNLSLSQCWGIIHHFPHNSLSHLEWLVFLLASSANECVLHILLSNSINPLPFVVVYSSNKTLSKNPLN